MPTTFPKEKNLSDRMYSERAEERRLKRLDLIFDFIFYMSVIGLIVLFGGDPDIHDKLLGNLPECVEGTNP